MLASKWGLRTHARGFQPGTAASVSRHHGLCRGWLLSSPAHLTEREKENCQETQNTPSPSGSPRLSLLLLEGLLREEHPCSTWKLQLILFAFSTIVP